MNENKQFKPSSKKALSVLMAVIMLISVWAFTPVGSVCSDPVEEHTFVESTDASDGYVAATCTTEGTGAKKCSVCLYTTTYTIPMLGHSWSEDYKITKYATCTRAGRRSKYCTRDGCDALLGEIYSDPYGHRVDRDTLYQSGISEDGSYSWETYKCKGVQVTSAPCSYTLTKITFFATSPEGEVLPGAFISIKTLTGKLVCKGQTDENGYFTSTELEEGVYAITGEYQLGRYGTSGAIAVAGGICEGTWALKDGHFKDNDSLDPCTCSCHKDSLIGNFKRWLYTLLSSLLGRTVKCCEDMEWYS